MIRIKFKKLNKKTKLPKKGSSYSACYDVYATEIIYSTPNLVTVKLGFSTEIPEMYKGIIVPRSSFTQKGWIMQNSPGQIDPDYRGEWMIKFEAIPNNVEDNQFLTSMDNNRSYITYNDFPYKEGDRVAQIFFEEVVDINFIEEEELETTERGTGGFGSTGKK